MPQNRRKILSFAVGLFIGILLAALTGILSYKLLGQHPGLVNKLTRVVSMLPRINLFQKHGKIIEKFSEKLEAKEGMAFGAKGALSFELYRGGAFIIDGKSGVAWQKSNSYEDVAIIRSTEKLPDTYKITVVVGDIDYDLEKIMGLQSDPRYPEGPLNENGCYLLAITDASPKGHHLNTWWHQHRKVVIDVDNNIWGQGMPNPIFMVYFDAKNQLVSFDGKTNKWQEDWKRAIEYKKNGWYKIEIEKTSSEYILSIYEQNGRLLKRGKVNLDQVWHADKQYPEYFVLGDPHENYYQGSMEIESIEISY